MKKILSKLLTQSFLNNCFIKIIPFLFVFVFISCKTTKSLPEYTSTLSQPYFDLIDKQEVRILSTKDFSFKLPKDWIRIKPNSSTRSGFDNILVYDKYSKLQKRFNIILTIAPFKTITKNNKNSFQKNSKTKIVIRKISLNDISFNTFINKIVKSVTFK
ncbi:MAG: hypothetical protein V3U80_00385 [Flavobacteriaceae bacterium]